MKNINHIKINKLYYVLCVIVLLHTKSVIMKRSPSSTKTANIGKSYKVITRDAKKNGVTLGKGSKGKPKGIDLIRRLQNRKNEERDGSDSDEDY